jgi:hypothetical protein
MTRKVSVTSLIYFMGPNMDLWAIFPPADTAQSVRQRPVHEAVTLAKRLGRKMMRKIAGSIIPVWFISAAILIFSVHDNFAYAKQTRTSVECGNAIKKQCSGVPVQANNVFECFQKSQDKLPKRCGALALNVIRTCDRDGSRLCQGVVAGSQGNIVGCLTTAKNMVSSQGNAALDAAGLR